jgi:hypothetical protein
VGNYKKKPVVIEAFQFARTDDVDITTIGLELASWCGGRFIFPIAGDQKCPSIEYHETHRYCPSCDFRNADYGISINTPEGILLADEGDWIVKGTHGEFYPVKPDIFATVYDEYAPDDEELQSSIPVSSSLAYDEPGQLIGVAAVNSKRHEIHIVVTKQEWVEALENFKTTLVALQFMSRV